MIAAALKRLDIPAVALHSQLKQKERNQSLGRFKSHYIQVLIATDVASRGLDIPDVELVINYDIPNIVEDYVHRIGRTARAGKEGRAISLVTQYDIDLVTTIEDEVGVQMGEFLAPENDVLKHLNESTSAIKIAEVEIDNSDFNTKVNMRKRKQRTDDNNKQSPPRKKVR